MSAVVADLFAGFCAGRLAWLALRPVFASAVFLRQNYRGRSLPTAAGLAVAAAVVVVEAGRAVAGAAGVGGSDLLAPGRALVLAAVLGFALFGAVDDLAGEGEVRGFRGHLGALLRGRLTTGGLKFVGGGALSLALCAPLAAGVGGLARDAALVALAANLGNLLDRAPGRTLKAGAVGFAALVGLAGTPGALGGVAVVVGAALALADGDLRERLMLGDAGANLLGGVLGLGVVLATGPAARAGVVAALVALNLASELVSFSRVIEVVPPLRALDRLGRLP